MRTSAHFIGVRPIETIDTTDEDIWPNHVFDVNTETDIEVLRTYALGLERQIALYEKIQRQTADLESIARDIESLR